MSAFKNLCLTAAEFASLAGLDKKKWALLESQGRIPFSRKKMGNVDRKVIYLEGIRSYFQTENQGRLGDRFLSHPVQMFYNVKGGTGKSTLSAQYAMQCALLGWKVLAIDLDGQGHLTVNLDLLDAHERPTLYDVLINDLPIEKAITPLAPGLDLIPANLSLCNIEIPLNQKTRREYRLGEALAQVIDQYDLIIADTNPAASILNGSMLVAADLVNVVCATNPLSFHGMSLVMTTIETLQREFKKQLAVKIIPNLYDNREVISQEVLGELQAQFPDQCTKTVMNRSADLNEATKRRTTVWEVTKKGAAVQDLRGLTEELLGGASAVSSEKPSHQEAPSVGPQAPSCLHNSL